MVSAIGELYDANAVWQAQRPPVTTVDELLHAWHRAVAQEPQQTGHVERRPVGQPKRDGSGRRFCVVPAGSPQLCRCSGEDGADGVVELADAREAGGEGRLRDR